MEDPTEYELEERQHLIDVLQFGAGAVIVAIGIVLMLTAALMPFGLIIFAGGCVWLMVASLVRRTGAENIHPEDIARERISNEQVVQGPH